MAHRLPAAVIAVALMLWPVSPAVGRLAAGIPAPSERMILGVMRSDGVLLPFASFNGRSWSTPWPATLAGRDLPVSVKAVPDRWWGGTSPMGWRLWPRGDMTSPIPFALTSPAMVPIGLSRRLGLRTDYPAALPPVPPGEFPFPKDGLAVAGHVEVQPISMVSVMGAGAQQLIAHLRKTVDAAEEQAISRLRAAAGWRHPIARADRGRVAPELEAWYTTPLLEPGLRVSYIEAVKKYPPMPDDDGCGLESFVSGWVHHDGRKTSPSAQLAAVVTYCDRDKTLYMLPFGFMVLRNRTHWVFQMSGQESEWYAVAEVSPRRTRYVAEYPAGGFPGQ